MKHLLITKCLALASTGCAPYAQLQMDLVEQARKGVELATETQTSHRAVADRLHALQRDRVDEAFDADVRERQNLDADWVIEHRRAYAAALDALASRNVASAQADLAARENLEATDAALKQLHLLQSLPLRILNIKEISR